MIAPNSKPHSRSADVQLNVSQTHTARPASKPSWRSTLKRLNAIDAQAKAAAAVGDWRLVAQLSADWSFVFRQSMESR